MSGLVRNALFIVFPLGDILDGTLEIQQAPVRSVYRPRIF